MLGDEDRVHRLGDALVSGGKNKIDGRQRWSRAERGGGIYREAAEICGYYEEQNLKK